LSCPFISDLGGYVCSKDLSPHCRVAVAGRAAPVKERSAPTKCHNSIGSRSRYNGIWVQKRTAAHLLATPALCQRRVISRTLIKVTGGSPIVMVLDAALYVEMETQSKVLPGTQMAIVKL